MSIGILQRMIITTIPRPELTLLQMCSLFLTKGGLVRWEKVLAYGGTARVYETLCEGPRAQVNIKGDHTPGCAKEYRARIRAALCKAIVFAPESFAVPPSTIWQSRAREYLDRDDICYAPLREAAV